MEWFEAWFASPYYHTLYQDRDEKEAREFIENLIAYLQPKTNDRFLDLACGAGRHAIHINKLGYSVVGTDLSSPSIDTALKSANDKLDFYVQDMRNLFRINYFNFIFNLFTSFGYFQNENDNIKTLKAAKNGLRQNGTIIIDFMNAFKVKKQLVQNEIKVVEDIEFKIERQIKDNFIFKNIEFTDRNGSIQTYREQVQYIDLEKFKYFIAAAGLKIKNTFGNYQLEAFNQDHSDRLILEIV